MKIITDFKNGLLKRREVVIEIESSANPGFANAIKEVSSAFKANEECVVLRKIDGRFGSHLFHIEAFVYDSKDEKEKIERKPKVKKVEGQSAPVQTAEAKK